MHSLEKLETWNLVDLPKKGKLSQTQWVFDEERNGNGNVSKYKARSVSEAFSKILGI